MKLGKYKINGMWNTAGDFISHYQDGSIVEIYDIDHSEHFSIKLKYIEYVKDGKRYEYKDGKTNAFVPAVNFEPVVDHNRNGANS